MRLTLVNRQNLKQVLTVLFIFMAFTLLATDKDNFTIKNNSDSQIDLQFNLGQWELETKTENGFASQKVKSNAKNMLYIDETETLPVYSAMVAIPDGMDVELVTDVKDMETVSAFSLQNRDMIYAAKGSDDAYPTRQIEVSEPGQFRDFRVVNVNVYPFQYDTRSNDLRVVQSADISLRFVPASDSYRNPAPGYYSASFDKIYNATILNYGGYRDEAVAITQPRLIVVYANNADTYYTTKLDQFLTWKKQKGYIVSAVTTDVTGTTGASIQNYLRSQYNNLSTRPDIVTFIGDTGGTLILPSFSGDYGDFPYTLMTIGDNFPDIQFGRISVAEILEFSNYVNKVMVYEKNVNLGDAEWLNRMLLVGDSASSGISTYYANYYIEDVSSAVNPNYTYTRLYASSPSTSAMNTAINNGVGFFNYRGYIGMSGWPGTMSNITTLNKLNHGVFITCSTSTFYSGLSTTEEYIRLGSDSQQKGGITAIGMATSSTHTAFNNCLMGAIFDGIFNHGMRNMGEATLFSRLYMYSVYGAGSSIAYNFIRYLNLMGDPTVETWVTIPKTFLVTYPTRIIAGTPMLEITVKNISNVPVAGATVNLWQASSNLNTTVYTNEQGIAYIAIPNNLSGTMTLTVSKHDFKPATGTLQISGSGLVYQNSMIDDDNTGGTSGNSNGIIDAGETIDLKMQIGNTSTVTISGISAAVTCTDPYVTLTSNALSFNNINAGSNGLSTNAIRFTVSPNCPDQHQIVFSSIGTSSAGEWTTTFIHAVRSPDLDYVNHTITGNGYLEIGETTQIYLSVINNGSEAASSVTAKLRSFSPFVSVTDSVKVFGNIASGSSFANSANPFTISAAVSSIVGMKIPMQLYLSNASGYNDTENFTLIIGNPTLTDPLGQDAYGYFIFDSGDIGYPQCSSYEWVELVPALGGSGTLLSINDPRVSGNEGDQVGSDAGELVTLPFTFKFYGIDYNQITVVSNGFLAFGATNNYDFRNWRLPGALGPNAMIAPFWDDLTTDGGGGIYAYNDAANNRFIIQWNNMKNGYDGSSVETFQVILYNPADYQTSTGDGPIKFQYKIINDVDQLTSTSPSRHGCYSTIGMKDHTGLTGLEYLFNNTYPVTSKTLTNEMALYISTAPLNPNEPFLWVTQTNIIDTNSNGIAEPNEELDLRLTVSNWGNTAAVNTTVTISSSDPWITIVNNTATYGTINGNSSVTNTSGLLINVGAGYQDNHTVTFNAVVSCNGYTFNRTFTILLRAPILNFGTMSIQDPTGNNNGSLDPGETATILIQLINSGGGISSSGTANISSPTYGITVHNPATVDFASIPAVSSVNLYFSITASSSMSIGTLASLIFNATAGSYTAYKNQPVEIGAPHEIIIGNGTSSQSFPLDRYYNYSVHESIYLASELESGSTIKSIAFYKSSGSDTNEITSVTVYMKHTTATSLSSGAYSTDGYTQVYSGAFPNNAASGWMEINLSPMFSYSGSTNLQILIVKDFQQWISSYPYWTYTSTGTQRARQDRDDSYMPTSLTSTNNLPNIRFKVFPVAGVLYPPQNLTATASHQSVKLDWGIPVTGTPTGYKIFKNGALLTTVTALTYTDLAVTNGTPYSYYLKAVYTGGESDATSTVIATPNAIPPTNLTATSGNGTVTLSWSGATGREFAGMGESNERTISGYKIYRNGSPITTTSNLTYQDTGLTNGTTYSYYVTTVYVNPAGESAASNTAQATPTEIVPVTAIIGTGTLMTGYNYVSPINTSYRSVHHQSVYTATELNTAGIVGPCYITHFGFNVNTAPTQSLPNYLIRMKHTTDVNMAYFQSADNLITVYSNASYSPVAGGFDLLTLSTPFLWNGIENLVVDTAFDLVGSVSQSGTLQYTSMTYGFRANVSDVINTANEFTSNFGTTNRRPNIKLTAIAISLSAPEVTIEKVTNGVRLSWQAVDGASAYKIYGSNDPEDGFALITSVTATQYLDTAAQTYRFYRITATDERNINSFRRP